MRIKKSAAGDDDELQAGLAEFSEYDALIKDAEAGNNFNLSIRYLYLQTLKALSDKELDQFLT